MCGIAGILHHDGRPADGRLLAAMVRSLAHRGPDHEGLEARGPVALGSRRLAIVDRSPAGEQPMGDDSGRIRVVCNGEIYNHLELRRELEACGARFRSHSDTEVIPWLYRFHGDDCVHHLRGMFAFALWDEERRRLLLARDRFGQKPLFWFDDGRQFAFASEIKALRRHPAFDATVDPAAINRFVAMDYIPAPGTVYAAVRKLPAAHRLVVEDGRALCQRYWRLDYGAEPARGDPAELQEELIRRFEESVRLRLMGEVPIGVFLSGGIDSNAIVSAVRRVGSGHVKTFSIGFDDADFDESGQARESARALDTEHHERILVPDLEQLLPTIVAHFDEPFGDPSAVPTWCLSEMAAPQITVALSGEGGDEAFAGYPRYRRQLLARRLWRLPGALRRALGGVLGHMLPASLDGAHPLRGLADLLASNAPSAHALYGRWLLHCDPPTAGDLYAPEFLDRVDPAEPAELLARLLGGSAARDPVNAMLDADQQTYLADDLLIKLDIATMAHSMEGRSPFLDHEFAGFVATLPGALKLRGSTAKWLLRQALRGRVPDAVLKREKRGFGLPLDRWLDGPLRPLLLDCFGSRAAQERGLFRPGAIQSLLDAGPRRRPQDNYLLWNLFVLELWLRSEAAPAAAGAPDYSAITSRR